MARYEVAKLGLNKGAQVAGRAVLDAENGAQVVFVLDNHTPGAFGSRE